MERERERRKGEKRGGGWEVEEKENVTQMRRFERARGRRSEGEREKAGEEQRVCVFEDRRGTEINCGGGIRGERGGDVGTTGKREKDEEERGRETEGERQRDVDREEGEREGEWDSARMGLRLPWRPS